MNNCITLYLNHGHGFIDLEYQPKEDQKLIQLYASFYPKETDNNKCKIRSTNTDQYSWINLAHFQGSFMYYVLISNPVVVLRALPTIAIETTPRSANLKKK